MSDEKKQDKGFTVSDRRRFSVSENGKVREEEKAAEGEEKPPEAQEAKEPEEAPREQTEPAGKQGATEQQEEPAALPEINFSTFVVSLSSSALIHMGVVADPMTGETKKELAVAKQTIDMLGMLQDKTRGNLTEEEDQLLESMLYDLRMRYVAESK
jgi:hypothetical protein